jgi:MtN3 and saliva related transmembrane protein
MIRIVVAYLAVIINSIYQLPQLFKIIKTKSVNDISLIALLLLMINNILWLMHGYFIKDNTLIISSLLNISLNIVIACLFLKHRTKQTI